MTAGRADRVSRWYDARTRHIAVLNALLYSYVIVVSGADVSHRCKARFQRALGVCHPDDRPEIVGKLQCPVAVISRIRGQVDMHVDEPWQQGHPWQIDMARTGGDRRILVGYGRNASIGDGNLWPRHDSTCQDVDHALGGNYHRIRHDA